MLNYLLNTINNIVPYFHDIYKFAHDHMTYFTSLTLLQIIMHYFNCDALYSLHYNLATCACDRNAMRSQVQNRYIGCFSSSDAKIH